jgi:hypothetical protein
MNVAQLMNYYPKYQYLDNILTSSGKKKMTLYIDLKGCMGSLYQDWAVKYVIEQSRDCTADPSIFASVLEFIGFHKLYAKKRRIDLKMVFFYESGESAYHANLLKDYKDNRDLGSFFDLDNKSLDLFKKVKDKNFDLIDKVCNKIPDVSVIRLMFLEADFIPWYIQRRVFQEDTESVNIIYSLDKDMLQCLDENTYMFYKHYKSHKLIGAEDVYEHYLKTELDWQADPELFFMVLAIDGDVSDHFKGVKGIGTKTIIKSFPDLLKCIGNAREIADNVAKGESIFVKGIGTNNKAVQKIMADEATVVRNIKLASYRVLSNHIDSGYPMVNVERKNYIHETVTNDQKITNGNVLYEALDKIGMTSLVQEATVYNLFN